MKYLLPLLLLIIFSCQKEIQEKPQPRLQICTGLKVDNLKPPFPPGKKKHIDPPPPPTGNSFVLFVNFNGGYVQSVYWNNGVRFFVAESGMTQEEKDLAMYRIKLSYAPYKVYPTDSIQVYNTSANRQMVFVTPTSNWYNGVTGIAYLNTYGQEVPAFVFSDRCSYRGDIVGAIGTHEAGHSAGLTHQTVFDPLCVLVSSYRLGVNMGNAAYVPFDQWGPDQWVYGTTYTCYLFQEDKLILTNLFGRR